jgi:hypothetical protein
LCYSASSLLEQHLVSIVLGVSSSGLPKQDSSNKHNHHNNQEDDQEFSWITGSSLAEKEE